MRAAVLLVVVALAGCQPENAPPDRGRPELTRAEPTPPRPEPRPPERYTLPELAALPPAEREQAITHHRYFHPSDDADLALYREAVIPVLLAWLKAPDPEVRWRAAGYHFELLRSAVSVDDRRSTLAAILRNYDGSTAEQRQRFDLDRRLAEQTFLFDHLGGIEPLMTAIAEATTDADGRVRGSTGTAIACLGPRAKLAVPVLLRSLNERTGEARREAAVLLWWVGRHPAVSAALSAELGADDPKRVESALAAVGHLIGADVPHGSDRFYDNLRSEYVREAAEFRPTGEDLPGVITLERARAFVLDPGKHFQVSTAEAETLLTANDKRLLYAVLDAATDDRRRQQAVAVLARVPAVVRAELAIPAARPVRTAVLIEAAAAAARQSADASVRLEVIEAVAKLGPAGVDAVPALVDALGATDGRVRQRAAEVLGKLGPAAKAAVKPLVNALKDDDLDARYAAGQALKAIDPETAKKALIP